MLRHYFVTALRALAKFKAYAIINLLGLALGLTTGIFILMYVMDELSFDRFHTKADRVFRVGTDMTDIKTGAVNGKIEANGWPVGMLLKKDYPEVESVVYLRNGSDLTISHEGKRFQERLFFASDDFFNIFSFPLVEGNPSTALTQPNTVVISETMEKKYFPGSSALGKTMVFVDTLSYLVTGVMKDVPEKSHMQFDILVSFATFSTLNKQFSYDDGWGNLNVRNYVLLKKGTDAKSFFSKARNLYMDYVKDNMKKFGMFMYVGFEPMKDVYLKSVRGNGMGPSGSIERVYIVSGIAAFVILLACINFINLSTARAAYRAKEVGLRKVVGSSRIILIRQFLSESFMLTLLAFTIALVLVGLLMPLFNQLVGKSYELRVLLNPSLIAGLVLLIVVISVLSGYYPALTLSALRPADVLKGRIQTSARGVQLRRVLVVFQFMISASLILCTLVARTQLDYMKNRELGFFGDQVVVLNVSKVSSADFRKHETFKNDLKTLSAVDHVTFANAVPGKPGWVGQWAHAAEKSADETIGVEYMAVDEDYISTLGLTLLAGHNFDLDRPAELEDGLIINEKTVQQMGWETPEKAIGKKIASPSNHPGGTVIGVVKNYHEFGLQKEIYPMTMDFNPMYAHFFAIKFKPTNAGDLVKNLEAIWKKHFDGYDFQYFFLDENFERQYQAEQRLSTVFAVFATMTIVIAIIGLVGLVSFMIVSKTKEIGIRKVLGANVASVAGMLSKEFLLLIVVANVIACPLSWYVADQWLQKFAYRTTVGPDIFFVTILAGILITLAVVSAQTVKAALANPVHSLRAE